MKLFAKIYESVVYVLLAVMLLFTAVIEVPRLFGYKPYIVQSGSMEPIVHTGSLVYTNTKDRDVEVGDIVSYKIPIQNAEGEETMVLHRIVGVREDGTWATKGDANEIEDGVTVTNDMIVGTYAWSIPYLGYFMAKLTFKLKIVILAWTVVLILLSFVFNKLAEDFEGEKETESDEKTDAGEKPEAGGVKTETVCAADEKA